MKKLKALIEKRNANLEAMGKMLDLCEAENRAFTDEEKIFSKCTEKATTDGRAKATWRLAA